MSIHIRCHGARFARLLLPVCLSLANLDHALAEDSPAPPQMRQVSVNGVTLSYQEQGQGTHGEEVRLTRVSRGDLH